MLDTKGNTISKAKVKNSMARSIVAGSIGMTWFILCTPQQVLTVYFKNYLGASSTVLGFLIGGINLAALFHLGSIYFYGKLRSVKRFWLITTIMQRLLAFAISFTGFYMAASGNKLYGIVIVLLASILGAALGNISASGWWSWMAAIVPERQRGTFFGKRSALTQAVNVLFFFSATLILDYFSEKAFAVFGILYLIAGIGGTVDIILHIFIPEPEVLKQTEKVTFKSALQPLQDKKFLRFCLLIGLYLFSNNIAAPYLAPYTTSEQGIGAPNIWLGIMVVISQGIWILVVPFWGIIMDRMGKKPVVILGGLFTATWAGYLFLTNTNYIWLLPIIAFTGGLLAPGFWEGISQMMLSLTDDKNRTAYVAWYWTFFGITAAAGSLIGGILYDFLAEHPLLLGQVAVTPIQSIIILSILMVLFSLTHLSRMQMKDEKSISVVLSTVVNPGVFRAFSGMGVLSRPAPSNKVVKVLSKMKGSSAGLLTSDIITRLEDPDSEVRSEAAKALGRIGTGEAESALISQLSDKYSPNKVSAARALGTMSSQKAVPFLTEALGSNSEELKEAAALSLGTIDNEDARRSLLNLIRSDAAESIKASSAIAISGQKVWEAAEDIFYLMHHAKNWILKRQLSIAMANMLGKPGAFYKYISGTSAGYSENTDKLFNEIKRTLFTSKWIKTEFPGKNKQLAENVTRIQELFLANDFPSCTEAVISLAEKIKPAFPEHHPYFHFGNWFLNKLHETVKTATTLDMDVLLAVYYLKTAISETASWRALHRKMSDKDGRKN